MLNGVKRVELTRPDFSFFGIPNQAPPPEVAAAAAAATTTLPSTTTTTTTTSTLPSATTAASNALLGVFPWIPTPIKVLAKW